MNQNDEVLYVKAYMKSGNIVEFYTKKLEKRLNPITGDTMGIIWQSVEGKEMLFDINLESIEAITVFPRRILQGAIY